MNTTDKSNSREQLKAEEFIFAIISENMKIEFTQNARLRFPNNDDIYICPDFFSEEHKIIGEIFSHIGKPKKAQDNKIANDILKMLSYEMASGKHYRKMLVVCDEQEYKKLQGKSFLAESIRQFKIELLYVDIGDALTNSLLEAQHRQRMVNE